MRRSRILRSGATVVGYVALIVTAYYLAPWELDDRGGMIALRVGLSVVVLVVAVGVSVRSVLEAEYPALRAFELITAVVTLAIIVFASVYVVVSDGDQTAFSEPLGRTSALYFSMTTATTIGYGDIHAQSDVGRIIVMVQMIVNVAIIGVAAKLIAQAARRRATS
jgi:hypothetical protein